MCLSVPRASNVSKCAKCAEGVKCVQVCQVFRGCQMSLPLTSIQFHVQKVFISHTAMCPSDTHVTHVKHVTQFTHGHVSL